MHKNSRKDCHFLSELLFVIQIKSRQIFHLKLWAVNMCTNYFHRKGAILPTIQMHLSSPTVIHACMEHNQFFSQVSTKKMNGHRYIISFSFFSILFFFQLEYFDIQYCPIGYAIPQWMWNHTLLYYLNASMLSQSCHLKLQLSEAPKGISKRKCW